MSERAGFLFAEDMGTFADMNVSLDDQSNDCPAGGTSNRHSDVEDNAKVKRRGGGLLFPAAVGEATLGTGRLRLGTGVRTLRLKLSKRFARSVRNRRLRPVIRVTAKDAGNVTRAARSVRVK